MRKLITTAVLACLLTMPILAQPPFGGGFGGMGRGGMSGDMLLTNADVQKELKLSDSQKESLKSARDQMTKGMQAAREEDNPREAMQKVFSEYSKAMAKVKSELDEKQVKRLSQIEVQAAAKMNQPSIFKREDVAKSLKLSGEQKESIKEALADLEKDVREVMEDAKGDRNQMFGAMKKVQGMNKETFDKIVKGMSEEQKKSWKDMQGEPFELKMGGGFGGGFGGKGKKKKEDF